MQCKKCSSEDIELYVYFGSRVLKCNSCGYDEGMEFEQHQTEKKSQKAKGQYSPYKAGGARRSSKIRN